MDRRDEVKLIKAIVEEALNKYARTYNLGCEDGCSYDFSFYWFKTPVVPDSPNHVKTTLKIYAQKSAKASPIVIYRDVSIFLKEKEEETTLLMWKKLLDKLLMYGIENIYNQVVTELDNLDREYPVHEKRTVYL